MFFCSCFVCTNRQVTFICIYREYGICTFTFRMYPYVGFLQIYVTFNCICMCYIYLCRFCVVVCYVCLNMSAYACEHKYCANTLKVNATRVPLIHTHIHIHILYTFIYKTLCYLLMYARGYACVDVVCHTLLCRCANNSHSSLSIFLRAHHMPFSRVYTFWLSGSTLCAQKHREHVYTITLIIF